MSGTFSFCFDAWTPSLPHEKLLWSAKLALKIKIFLWQMAKGRLPSNG
jgi:hypothetical protein